MLHFKFVRLYVFLVKSLFNFVIACCMLYTKALVGTFPVLLVCWLDIMLFVTTLPNSVFIEFIAETMLVFTDVVSCAKFPIFSSTNRMSFAIFPDIYLL